MKAFSDLYFTTSTIQYWYPLLQEDMFKDVLVDSFRHAVRERKATIYGFVIMSNHFHIIWRILPPHSLRIVHGALMSHSSHQFKRMMVESRRYADLELFRVNKMDREYQFWKRRSLHIEIFYQETLRQKLKYIHQNLYRKGGNDLEYKYSSARFHELGVRDWDFL